MSRASLRSRSAAAACALLIGLGGARPAAAQAPDPGPIGPVVVDVHGVAVPFPDDPALAASRGLTTAEMPGLGFGLDAGVHAYPLRWHAVTFGIGGHVIIGRSTHTPRTGAHPSDRPVAEHLLSASPQLSFNFGKGDGWSYLSGGIGRTIWSIVPDGAGEAPADRERLKTIDYGGGARWFVRPHLAVGFDVRFYAINPGTPAGGRAGSPRTTLLVIGGGIAVN